MNSEQREQVFVQIFISLPCDVFCVAKCSCDFFIQRRFNISQKNFIDCHTIHPGFWLKTCQFSMPNIEHTKKVFTICSNYFSIPFDSRKQFISERFRLHVANWYMVHFYPSNSEKVFNTLLFHHNMLRDEWDTSRPNKANVNQPKSFVIILPRRSEKRFFCYVFFLISRMRAFASTCSYRWFLLPFFFRFETQTFIYFVSSVIIFFFYVRFAAETIFLVHIVLPFFYCEISWRNICRSFDYIELLPLTSLRNSLKSWLLVHEDLILLPSDRRLALPN